MANIWVFETLRRKFSAIMLSGFVFAGVGLLFVFFVGPEYSVRTDYLVSQEDAGTKDYYTLARSAEYMSKVLGEVVISEKFIGAVIDTGKVDRNFLPTDKRDRLDEWKKMVVFEKEIDLGKISVTVSGDNLLTSQKVSQAISQIFTEKNAALLGTGEKNVPISVLSGPIAERNPGFGKAILAVIAGFVFGALAAVAVFAGREGSRRGF